MFPFQTYTLPLAPPEYKRSGTFPYVAHIMVSFLPASPKVPLLEVNPPPVCVQNLMCFIPAVTRRSALCGSHLITKILSLWPLHKVTSYSIRLGGLDDRHSKSLLVKLLLHPPVYFLGRLSVKVDHSIEKQKAAVYLFLKSQRTT